MQNKTNIKQQAETIRLPNYKGKQTDQNTDKNGKRTLLEHGEVGGIDWEQMQVRREAGNELQEGVVDVLIGAAVPAGHDTPLGWGQEKLEQQFLKKTK